MSRKSTKERRRRGAAQRGRSRLWLMWGGMAVVLVAIAAVFAVSRLGLGGPSSSSASAGRRIDALDFEFTMYRGADVLGGDKLKFSSLFGQGKPVVLNFFAGQCPPCRAEMPGIQTVYDEMGDQFTLVGVDIGPFVGLGSRDDGRNLVDELDITYPTATTFDSSVVPRYKIRGMPTTVFLTADGELVDTHPGLLDSGTFRSKLQDLFQISAGS